MRLLALMVLLFAGAQSDAQLLDPDIVISLTRTSCFGSCPAYTVDIKNDGTVIYEGKYAVAVQGPATSKISKEKVQELIRRFEEAKVFEMEVPQVFIDDAPSVILEVKAGTRRRKIEDCRLEETDAKKLAKLVDDIAETSQWVGPVRTSF